MFRRQLIGNGSAWSAAYHVQILSKRISWICRLEKLMFASYKAIIVPATVNRNSGPVKKHSVVRQITQSCGFISKVLWSFMTISSLWQ